MISISFYVFIKKIDFQSLEDTGKFHIFSKPKIFFKKTQQLPTKNINKVTGIYVKRLILSFVHIKYIQIISKLCFFCNFCRKCKKLVNFNHFYLKSNLISINK